MINVDLKKMMRRSFLNAFLVLGASSQLIASADNFKEQEDSFKKFCITRVIESKKDTSQLSVRNALQFIQDFHTYENSKPKSSAPNSLSRLFASYVLFLQDIEAILTHVVDGYAFSEYAENMFCLEWEGGFRDYLVSCGYSDSKYLSSLHKKMHQNFVESGHISGDMNPVFIPAHGISKASSHNIFMYRDEGGEFLAFSVPKMMGMQENYVKNIAYGPRTFRGQGDYCFIFDNEGWIRNPGYLIVNEANGVALEVRIFMGEQLDETSGDLAFKNQSASILLPCTVPMMPLLAESTEILSRNLTHVFLPFPTTFEEYQEFRYAMLAEIQEMIESYVVKKKPSQAQQTVIDTLVEAFVVDELESLEEGDVETEVKVEHLTESLSSISLGFNQTSASTSEKSLVVACSPETKNEHYLSLISKEKESLEKILPKSTIKDNPKPKQVKQKQQKAKRNTRVEKSTKQIVSSTSSSTSTSAVEKRNPEDWPRGTVKQRKLARIIAKMARTAEPSDLHVIVNGSHDGYHRSGSRSQTLVRMHGKNAKGVSRFKGVRVLRNFADYFSNKLQNPEDSLY